MKNILIDVGAHQGQSLSVALNGRWNFHQVHSFEPDPECCDHIRANFANLIDDGRLVLHELALGRDGREAHLRGDNSGGGASIALDFGNGGGPERSWSIRIADVNEFILGLERTDNIFMKLNCEGAEVEILSRMCELPHTDNIRSILADFDIVKASFGFWKKRRCIAEARAARLPIVLSENVMVGKSHEARISNWFAMFPELCREEARHVDQSFKRKLRYAFRDLKSAAGFSSRGYK